MTHSRRSQGFTIVELLIVIVVIAVLATITIVAFNGIQRRASEASATSAVNTATKKIELYKAANGPYPTTLVAAEVSSSAGTTYEYSTSGTGATYCVTATTNKVSMYASNTQSTPASGGCPGHAINGIPAVNNFANDPSFETNALGSLSYMGYTGGYSTAKSDTGASSYVINGAAIAADAYKDFYIDVPAGTINVSLKVYITAAGTPYTGRYTWIQCGGGTCATIDATPVYNLSLLNQWQTISRKMNFTTAGRVWVRLYGLTSSSVYFDSLMVTDGSDTTYKDGNSSGWTWTGSVNASPSKGSS